MEQARTKDKRFRDFFSNGTAVTAEIFFQKKEKHGYKGKNPSVGWKEKIPFPEKSVGTKRGIQEILNWENFLEKGKWVQFFDAILTDWPFIKT